MDLEEKMSGASAATSAAGSALAASSKEMFDSPTTKSAQTFLKGCMSKLAEVSHAVVAFVGAKLSRM